MTVGLSSISVGKLLQITMIIHVFSELDCCRTKVRKPEQNEAAKGTKADKDKKVALANIDINNYASMYFSNRDFVSAFMTFYCGNMLPKVMMKFNMLNRSEHTAIVLLFGVLFTASGPYATLIFGVDLPQLSGEAVIKCCSSILWN